MANTTLTQTGAQVQSILDKADKLPATVGTNGQVLTSDGTNLSWQTPQGGGGSNGYTLIVESMYATNKVKIIYANGTTEVIPQGTNQTFNNVIAIEVLGQSMGGTEILFYDNYKSLGLVLPVDDNVRPSISYQGAQLTEIGDQFLLLSDTAIRNVNIG